MGCCLYAVTPNNQHAEKQKFFDSDFTYNPQFTYTNPTQRDKYSALFTPQTELLDTAKTILDRFIDDFGTEDDYLDSEGPVLS